MGKKDDVSDFEHGMVVGAIQAHLSISETADSPGFFIFGVYKEWSEKQKLSSEQQLCG